MLNKSALCKSVIGGAQLLEDGLAPMWQGGAGPATLLGACPSVKHVLSMVQSNEQSQFITSRTFKHLTLTTQVRESLGRGGHRKAHIRGKNILRRRIIRIIIITTHIRGITITIRH